MAAGLGSGKYIQTTVPCFVFLRHSLPTVSGVVIVKVHVHCWKILLRLISDIPPGRTGYKVSVTHRAFLVDCTSFRYLSQSNHRGISRSQTHSSLQWKWHLALSTDVHSDSCFRSQMTDVFFLLNVEL